MILNIIIFFIAIIIAFGMLTYRAWEIKTSRVIFSGNINDHAIKIPFRRIEKIMIYSAKYIIQSIVVIVVKYWFIITIKIKKKILPKIQKYFSKKDKSFVRQAIEESRVKIKNIKEKVKEENSVS